VSSLRLILRSRVSPDPHHKISDDMTSTEACQEGETAQDPSRKTLAPLTFDVKFPCDTQLNFGSLTFAAREDRDLKMLPPEPAPEHLALASSAASGGSCSGSDPCARSYIRTAKIVRGILVVTSILRPLAGSSSSSTSTSAPDPDSSDDYPEIEASACGEPVEGGRLICMVIPNGDRSNNTSSRYPTIGRSEVFNARTPSGGLVWKLNPDFNAVRVQAIVETIQRMAPDGSPLAVLAQQGTEAANLVVAEKSAGFPRSEPSIGDNDRVRRALSEAASSASPNRRLSKHDVRRRITQNCVAREYVRERDDLHNIIEDWRHLMLRTPSPPQRSLAEDVALMGKSGFRALA
jgi:hypothetical protein